jgi:hypothetical protein
MKNKEIDKNYEDEIKKVSKIDKTKLSNDLFDKDRNDLSKLKE